jgi:hypothetical protein
MADYVNGKQFWPKYALLTHAIELALKAFVHHSAPAGLPRGTEPKQHDLSGWYQLAVTYGLSSDPSIEENVEYLNDLHRVHYMRYPQRPSRPVPDLSIIADATVDHLLDHITVVIAPRYTGSFVIDGWKPPEQSQIWNVSGQVGDPVSLVRTYDTAQTRVIVVSPFTGR